MNRGTLIDKLFFDYKDFFETKEVNEYKTQFSAFLKENKNLSDDEFFKKFQETFHMSKSIDGLISRTYLMRMAANLKTIKNIMVFYLILSILGALLYLFQGM